MKKFAKIAAIPIAVVAACPSALALQISDDESALRFRLKNELRRADKPSAGAGRDIYAWVQGGLIDFNSSYYSQRIGVEGSAYYVYKLGARDNMSTRWYLDGHESFGYVLGAIKIKPTENSRLKIGRLAPIIVMAASPGEFHSSPAAHNARYRPLPKARWATWR